MHTRELHTDQRRNRLQQSPRAELPDVAGVETPELAPDTVLPEQFYGPPRGAVHIRSQVALMRAVLSDALHCYQKQFIPSTRRQQRLARKAEEWLFNDDDRWPFSFVNVCRALGLEPESLRWGLKEWHHRPPAERQGKHRAAVPTGRRLRIAA